MMYEPIYVIHVGIRDWLALEHGPDIRDSNTLWSLVLLLPSVPGSSATPWYKVAAQSGNKTVSLCSINKLFIICLSVLPEFGGHPADILGGVFTKTQHSGPQSIPPSLRSARSTWVETVT